MIYFSDDSNNAKADNICEIINRFRDVAEKPYEYACQLKADKNIPVVGNLCNYIPEEIIVAAGCLPFRIFGESKNTMHSDALIQSYCCSVVKSVLDDAMGNKLSFLNGMVFPHVCDSMQRLSDIWRLNIKDGCHFDVLFPVKIGGHASKKYMIAVLRKFKSDIENILKVKVDYLSLKGAITLLNNIRKNMMHLYELKALYPGIIKGSDLNAVVKGSMVMYREDVDILLNKLVKLLNERINIIEKPCEKRILISGSICSQPAIYDIIEDQNACVVGDDLCTGLRNFDFLIDENVEPIEAIAEKFLKRLICPAKYIDNSSRSEYIKNMVKTYSVDGVIFIFLKFCEPFFFDYPYLKTELDSNNISSILVEISSMKQIDEQIRTRIETFLQIL